MKKYILAGWAALLASPLMAEEVQETARQSSFMQTIIMIGIAIIFFYFILWRPEQRRRKQMETLRTSMKKGDVVVAMGIVGTIDRIKDTTVVIRNVDGSKIEVLKGAISEIKAPEDTKVEEINSSDTK